MVTGIPKAGQAKNMEIAGDLKLRPQNQTLTSRTLAVSYKSSRSKNNQEADKRSETGVQGRG